MALMKKIDIKEFHEFGFLQEVNRQFFHPLGLALEVIVNEDGEEEIGGLFDARDDPEGIIFGDFNGEVGVMKARRVQQLQEEKAKVRRERFGYVVQPISCSGQS